MTIDKEYIVSEYSKSRFSTLLLSGIIISIILLSCVSQPFPEESFTSETGEDENNPIPENNVDQKTSIEGLWKQYMLVNEDYFYGGTFVVTKNSGTYEMHYYDEDIDREIEKGNQTIKVTSSKGLYDITFIENIWEFKSEWSGDRVGVFKLNERYPDIFEGYAYENGVRKTFNRWERVK